MTTSYPGSLDSFVNPTSTDTLSSSTVPHAAQHDNANDAIAAVESTLGVNPQGSYSTVAARLAASTGSITTWRKAAAGGETSLSGTDDFSTTLAYTVGQEQFFINGVLLERGVDYTASTGSSITGLTALVAGDIATVISVGSFNVANAIPLATVTAKGDLLAATGASTVSNVAVGADGTTLVANSSASTGVAWTAGNPIPNPVLNSAMQVWQRGTSVAVSGASALTYAADRWGFFRGAYATGMTVSRQATGDTTNLPFIQYGQRVQRDSGNTSTGIIYTLQNFESINSIPFASKTVTFSFYARAGANFSAASNALAYSVNTGTGTDQNLLSGFTGQASPISSSATLTTTWQRFTATGTISSTATQIGLLFSYTPVGTAGTNDYFEVTGVQVDVSPVALPFRTNAPTLQGELAACQRYYYRIAGQSYQVLLANTFARSTGNMYGTMKHPVTMRTQPAFGSSNVNSTDFDIQYAGSDVTVATLGSLMPNTTSIGLATGGSGFTVGQGGLVYIAAGATSAWVDVSAEL